MNKLSTEKRVQVIAALVEGNSIRATVRMTGAAKNTVVKLLCDLGQACDEYQDRVLRDLPCKRIECDEIWAFCYAKERNVPADKQGKLGYGDVWTWTAIDAETKLMPSWYVGGRHAGYARIFMEDLASRLANRVQLTTDGHSAYLDAVPHAFGNDIDYAMLVKTYGAEPGRETAEARYSPPKCNGSRKRAVIGQPDTRKVSTSYAERANLTMRMGMRRFTRLTNGFSKKLFNHQCAVALHFMHYNYCRKHQTINKTPAQAAGVADHQWTIEELIGLLGSN